MATTTKVKCDCAPCSCMVSPSTAVEKGGKYYCSEACATGHANDDQCGKSGCGCGG